ncbi:MAG: hypothetical protein ACOCP4_04905, partial [Candidatus Woesearchaeota archaeon]
MINEKTKNIIKIIGITFVFIISSISLINTSGELNEKVERHYNYINEDKNNKIGGLNLETNNYSEKLNLVDYNYYLQKFIYSLVVFGISFVLFIINLEKRFSIM